LLWQTRSHAEWKVSPCGASGSHRIPPLHTNQQRARGKMRKRSHAQIEDL